ncbi:MAG TPA: hypothetical protein VE954_05355 [Oligoflexus sp.]|uniref:hypothetical protein n=1 Tax=Oligoflexus sp. TaxID=1971216 RepID=UPI002D274F07|nr:hypothetical protein [Oligoflexus sp.]HYX32520.1 hypothetical protein [Oligoflexus sp.]
MSGKIGFAHFNLFESRSVSEFDAYKKLERRLEPNGVVKSLAESHPNQPPIRTEAPGLNVTPDKLMYRLASELAPWMDEFHTRILDRARIRERLKMIERNRLQNDGAELKYYRHVDLLDAWITELLFERVYRRIGREHAMFLKVAQREWLQTEQFNQAVREQRIADANVYPELHLKELVHPYRFEIKIPNEKKSLEKLEERIHDQRHIVQDLKVHSHELRRVLHDIIFDEVKLLLTQQYSTRREHYDKQGRWHMRDVQQAFEKAWMHAWDSRDTFRELVRRGIFEQAEVYPRLFRKAIRDPFEIEIRKPNQKDQFTKIQEHVDLERKEVALLRLEEEADRQLLKNNKLELAAYRLVSAENIEEQRLNSEWQKHVLVERRDKGALERREYIYDAKRVESQGYQLLAGRMIPQPRFGIDADIITRVPLTMGLNGDPRAPEHVAPTPLLMVPQQQKDNWQKLRAVQEEEQHHVFNDNQQGWNDKTQSVRQNLAALEYGEQKAKELHRSEVKPETADPGPREAKELIPRAASIPDLKLVSSDPAPQSEPKLTKKKE